MDFSNAIISSILDGIDQVGAHLVANTYHNLVRQYSGFIWTMTAIYVGFLCLQAMQGHKSFFDLLNAIFRTVFILMLALNYEYFALFIYDIVTQEPLTLMKAITMNGSSGDTLSINQALDHYLNLGLGYANKLFMMGSWDNLTYFLFALIVFVMTLISMVFAAGLIILSKCAAVILLALSPLFIFFALFEMSRGLCEAYFRHLITYALIPVITSAILMILFSVSDYIITYVNQFPKISFKAIAPFILLCGIQIYLLAQVFSKASALGAGFALSGLVSTLNKAKDNVKTAANMMTGGSIGRRAAGMVAVASGTAAYKAASHLAGRMNRFRKPNR